MKTRFLTFVFIALFTLTGSMASAQKYAYVRTDYILNNIPAYADAQEQLDQLSKQWQQEVEGKFSEVDKLYQAYLKEQILLTEDLKKKREGEIVAKEKEAKEFQKSKFGADGELFRKRQELIKPIQEEIYNAIEQIATTGNYAVIFDKSGDTNIMWANTRYDKSEDVLRKMGITPSAND